MTLSGSKSVPTTRTLQQGHNIDMSAAITLRALMRELQMARTLREQLGGSGLSEQLHGS